MMKSRASLYRSQRRQQGYIFLAGAALVLVASAAAVVTRYGAEIVTTQKVNRIESMQKAGRIIAAVDRFVARNGRMPCPADGQAPLRSVNGSTEVSRSNSSKRCNFPGGNMARGVVPWATLGLTAEDALDEWNRRISFRVWDGASGTNTGSLVQPHGMDYKACATAILTETASANCVHPAPTTEATLAALDAHGGNGGNVLNILGINVGGLLGGLLGGILNYGSVNLSGVTPGDVLNNAPADIAAATLNDLLVVGEGFGVTADSGPGMAPASSTGAAYVVVSHGENGLGGWTVEGGRLSASVSAKEVANASATGPFRDAGFGGSDGNTAFDDLFAAVSIKRFIDGAYSFSPLSPDDEDSGTVAVGDAGGIIDIIDQNSDSAYFKAGGTGASKMEFVTNPDGTNVLNFGERQGNGNDGTTGSPVVLPLYTSGCTWIDQPLNFTRETIRAFFEFRVHGAGNTADGFTFGMIPGTTNVTGGLPCGNSKEMGTFNNGSASQIPAGYDPAPPGMTYPHKPNGSDLGWVGAKFPGYVNKFPGPKMGMEFDFYFSGYNKRNDPNFNHVAFVRENSVIHGNQICSYTAPQAPSESCTNDFTGYAPWGTNPACNGSTTPGAMGCAEGDSKDWLEDRNYCAIYHSGCCANGDTACTNAHPTWQVSDRPYRVRIEAKRHCNSNCSVCGIDGQTKVLLKAWVDCSDKTLCTNVTDDLSTELAAIPGVKRLDYCMADPGGDFGTPNAFDTVKLGMTMGTGALNAGLQITNFTAANTNVSPVVNIPADFQTTSNMPRVRYGGSAKVYSVATTGAAITASDAELDGQNAGNGNYSGAVLTVKREAVITNFTTYAAVPEGPSPEDVFNCSCTGASFTFTGTQIKVGSAVVANVGNSGGTLQISFTDANGVKPTRALLNEVISRITYQNVGIGIVTKIVLLRTSLRDGTGAAFGEGAGTSPVMVRLLTG